MPFVKLLNKKCEVGCDHRWYQNFEDTELEHLGSPRHGTTVIVQTRLLSFMHYSWIPQHMCIATLIL